MHFTVDEATLVSDVVLHLSHRPILARELAAAVDRGTRISPDLEHAVTGELAQVAASADAGHSTSLAHLLESWQGWAAENLDLGPISLSPDRGDARGIDPEARSAVGDVIERPASTADMAHRIEIRTTD